MELTPEDMDPLDVDREFREGQQRLLLPVNHHHVPQPRLALDLEGRRAILMLHEGEGEIEIKQPLFYVKIEIFRQIGKIVGEINGGEIDIELRLPGFVKRNAFPVHIEGRVVERGRKCRFRKNFHFVGKI